MPYKDPQKQKESIKKYYSNKKKGLQKFPPIKIPSNIKETQYVGYYIGTDGKAYRSPGKYDRYTELNEYGLIPLNTHLRGNPQHKKYQYPSINVTLRDENGKFIKQKKVNIHRLVAETFIPNPHNYNSVDHKDRNKHNNHVNNLKWCSIEDNKASWERTDEYIKSISISLRKDTVHGIGVNDSDIPCSTSKNYKRWERILRDSRQRKIGICDEWKFFSNFNSWVKNQKIEDNSIVYLIEQNKYCPENCVILTYKILNVLSFKKMGKYPIGVSLSNPKKMKNIKYNARISKKYLGSFNTIEEAHLSWQNQKIKEIELLIAKENDSRILNKLELVKNSIQDDIANRKETIISPFLR